MPAPKGHPMWGNPLNPKKYTPEEFWIAFTEYIDWCDKNPVMINEQSKMPQRLPSNYNKETYGPIKNFLKQVTQIPAQRAYSIEGFCNYADISIQTFYNYESEEYNKDDKTFFEVCKRVRQVIDEQHFTGGMAGTFNANIVTRKLGLKENMSVDVKKEQPLFPDVPKNDSNQQTS